MLSERVIHAFAALKEPSPWRNRALAALGILLALAAAFSAGRFSGPAKVETRDVEKVVYKDKIVTVEKIVTVTQAAKTVTQVIWRDRVIQKDGVIVEHEVVKTADAETSKVSIADNSERTATLDGSKTSDVSKTVTMLPRWRVGVMVGAQYPQPLLPIAGPLVLGVFGEYRIFGGLSAGLWVTTGLAGGALVSFDF